MATGPLPRRNRAAKDFLEPALDEVVLPSRIETEVEEHLENEEYLAALVTAIYFD